MPVSQWTTDIIIISIIIAAACAVIGYFVASFRHGGQLGQLTSQLEQTKQAQGTVMQELASSQDQLKTAEQKRHVQEVEGGRLQAQLDAAREQQQGFEVELKERKADSADLQQQLKQVSQQQHDAEKGLETAQAESRAQKEQIGELRERLSQAEGQNRAAQGEINQLKEQLASEGKRAQSLQSADHEVREQLTDTKQTLGLREQTIKDLQERLQQIGTDHTELKTTLQKREEHFQEQMAQLSDAKKSLTQEFENLANKIFDEKGKTFTQSSQVGIDNLLKPFREQIDGFQKRINEVHDISLQGNTQLNTEIRKVLDIGLHMSKEANNLTSALKGDSQQRGAWGEAQLRRTLEMSGLVEETHYEVQSSFKDSEGKHKQTDYLVKLPDGKHIIIDSKVSLLAYDRAVATESPEAYQLAMAEHIKAVRKHIDDLASKDYTNLIGMHSPSFVLMFMPIEPAYIEALKNNKDLFEYGYNKGIVLVSHTTLIPILRTVSNLWMIERSNTEAREISEKAGDIYNQVCLVAERLSSLGGTLNTVSNHYNNTVKALVGKQGLYGKVERFNKLSTKVSKTLPQLEAAHIDFEHERLSLIVEAIDEAPDLATVETTELAMTQ
ncbi:DNA recombination protein RmuC [Yersinia intermedia]|uniref:DNA recombination protein RmuC n=1 Tax=Yersinia intermedia TaxID=631 RepID=UPI0039C5C106